MKKWLFLFVALFSVRLASIDVVTPFGGIIFEDNLLEVINKINQLGVETFILNGVLEKPSLMQVNSAEGIKKAIRIIFDPRSKMIPYKLRYLIVNDIKGKPVKILEYPFQIIAKNINIKGVPFQLEIDFQNAPGLILSNPTKLILLDQDVNLAHGITLIKLESRSPLLKDNYKELNALFKKKFGVVYQNALKINNGKGTNLILLDYAKNGDKISGYLDIENGCICRIEYESKAFWNKLSKALEDRKKKLEKERSLKEKDQSDKI